MRTLLFAILLFSASASAGAIDTPQKPISIVYGGATLTLPLPKGYCEIPRDTAEGQAYYKLQEIANAGSNRVAAIFVACEEWPMRVADPNYRFHHYGNYLLPIPNGEQLFPQVSRGQFIEAMASIDLDPAKMQESASGKLEEAGSTGKPRGLTYHPKSSDENAVYVPTTVQLEYSDEKAALVGVQGLTLVRQAPFALNLYADYQGQADIDRLLAEQKVNMAALVEANDAEPAPQAGTNTR